MKHLCTAVLLLFIFSSYSVSTGRDVDDEGEQMVKKYTVAPIGWIRKSDDQTTIELKKEYQPGLLGLEGFSHVYVYWWFDRNNTPEKRAILRIHPSPPGNMSHPLTGVFATRSPFRPNLIAMTLCRIISVKNNVVQIEGIDAFADTPVLDIKPHVPRFDTAPNATIPWWLKKK